MVEYHHCKFEGNPDLYGIGIRLGLYLQWYSTPILWLANTGIDDTLLESYCVFVLALVVSLIVSTVEESAQKVDLFILSYILYGKHV